ncbi:MAG: c-type cytochrome [Acidobacteriaceae bacterium]|nr:c-type cytochrome [Acidobacteriaceae bacterium]
MMALGVQAQDRPIPRIVTWNCSGCHGIDGNTKLPYFPRLAGLKEAFAEKKIEMFRAAASPPVDEVFAWIVDPDKLKEPRNHPARVNMIGIAHAITPEESKAAAAWYAAQQPKPGRHGNPALIEMGSVLFANGLPSQHVPACKGCHGAQAQGVGAAPRIAGQNAEYIMSQLAKFSAGDRQHAPEMTLVTRELEGEQARAVAEYLQSR